MAQHFPLSNKIITVDGPAGAGKGTVCRLLVQRYGLAYLDSGLVYRAFGVLYAAQGCPTLSPTVAQEIASGLTPDFFTTEEAMLRTEHAAELASRVAVNPSVRTCLNQVIRGFVAAVQAQNGALVDGRDIGQHVLPEADVKFYLTASARARARRRFQELQKTGKYITEEEVLAQIQQRDTRDSEREACPLAVAEGCVEVDTTSLLPENVFEFVVNEIEKLLPKRAGKATCL